MDREFFNYTTHIAESRWDRRTFVRQWWRIYGGDNRWVPPHHAHLLRALNPEGWAHLRRHRQLMIHLEAVERRRSNNATMMAGMGSSGVLSEQSVCAAIGLSDPRRQDRTGTLALLRFVNDEEPLERFLWTLMERGMGLGVGRFIGPTGLSPHLQSGVLLDQFHLLPPLHTPYNPPYVPEVIASVMEPIAYARLFAVEVNAQEAVPSLPTSWSFQQATTQPQLTELGLLVADTMADHPLFPAPDADEWTYLLNWLAAWPLEAWRLLVDEQAVGFFILQPDMAPVALRARGGRNPGWRAWLAWRQRRPVRAGRLVFGGTLPDWQRQGIGRALWQHALTRAGYHGWRRLTIGPILDASPAAHFLTAMGAAPHQRYAHFSAAI